jgi:hypothetical protein
MTKPYVGMVVQFFINNAPGLGGLVSEPDQPLAAIVTKVFDDDFVGLALFNERGQLDMGHQERVPFMQHDGFPQSAVPFCAPID